MRCLLNARPRYIRSGKRTVSPKKESTALQVKSHLDLSLVPPSESRPGQPTDSDSRSRVDVHAGLPTDACPNTCDSGGWEHDSPGFKSSQSSQSSESGRRALATGPPGSPEFTAGIRPRSESRLEDLPIRLGLLRAVGSPGAARPSVASSPAGPARPAIPARPAPVRASRRLPSQGRPSHHRHGRPTARPAEPPESAA